MKNLSPKIAWPSVLIYGNLGQTLIAHFNLRATIVNLKGRNRLRWEYPFFGLTPEYKVQLHELIFDLVHYGQIEYFAVYDMPVQYRMFYIRKLINIKDKEKRDMENAS